MRWVAAQGLGFKQARGAGLREGYRQVVVIAWMMPIALPTLAPPEPPLDSVAEPHHRPLDNAAALAAWKAFSARGSQGKGPLALVLDSPASSGHRPW